MRPGVSGLVEVRIRRCRRPISACAIATTDREPNARGGRIVDGIYGKDGQVLIAALP